MMDGIKFNLTYLILQKELTVPIMLRRSEFKFMLTAELEEYTFLINFIPKKIYQKNSDSLYQ